MKTKKQRIRRVFKNKKINKDKTTIMISKVDYQVYDGLIELLYNHKINL